MTIISTMMLYDLPLERALDAGNIKKTTEEEIRTTVTLPQPIRIALSALKEERNEPMKYIISQVITHGHSILQHKHSDSLESIRLARKELAYPKMQPIRNFLHETKFTVDGMARPVQRTITLPTKTLHPLKEKAITLSIEQSSMIRLCIFFSFATSYSIDKEIVKSAKHEINVFQDRLIELMVLYPGLAQIDRDYHEMCTISKK